MVHQSSAFRKLSFHESAVNVKKATVLVGGRLPKFLHYGELQALGEIVVVRASHHCSVPQAHVDPLRETALRERYEFELAHNMQWSLLFGELNAVHDDAVELGANEREALETFATELLEN